MTTNRFMIGTLLGTTTILLTGYVLFALTPLRAFYEFAMTAGSAANVPRSAPLTWAVLLGAIAYGALVALAIESRITLPSVGGGMTIGAVVGFLLWFTADFMLLAISNVGNLTSTIVAPFVEAIPGALAGGAIAAVLGRTSIAHSPHVPRRTAA